MADERDEAPGDHDADLWDDASDTVVSCPHCGEEVYEDAEHCPSCGSWILAEERDRPADDREDRSPWKRRLVTAAVILAVLGLLLNLL